MRLVVVEPLSRRGEGLGNEAIGWAKGFLASQALRARLIGPAWGLNPRKYWRNFGGSRFDVLRNAALLRLPHRRFTERDFHSTGCTDFGHAISLWAENQPAVQSGSCIIAVGGMYGGYRCIRRAAHFLRLQLLRSHDALANVERVTRVLDRDKLLVAVHMRLGDFSDHPQTAVRGQFNFRLPAHWYASACRAVRAEFGDAVDFMFFTDQRTADYEALAQEFNAVPTSTAALSECSDLTLLAEADLRICSVSSYSLLACFLSGGAYLWYEPQLLSGDDGYRIWSDESATSGHARDRGEGMGYPYAAGDVLPPTLVEQLRQRVRMRSAGNNLIEYGAVPVGQGRHKIANASDDTPSIHRTPIR